MIKRWAWALVKPVLAMWLADRALRLPQSETEEMARTAGLPVEAVRRLNDLFTARVLAELDAFRP